MIINLIRFLKLFTKIKILKKYTAVEKWYWDKGESKLRLDYPLASDSIVFDLGGYKGDWANKIYRLYSPSIYIFEPVTEYHEYIKNRFNDIKSIFVYNFGLGANNDTVKIGINDNSSSVYKQNIDNFQLISIKSISDFLVSEGIAKIDLIKINIEGSEFDLVDYIIDTGIINIIKDIQIQFHPWIDKASERRDIIRNKLKSTHFETYNYPFIWENWSKKTKVISNNDCN